MRTGIKKIIITIKGRDHALSLSEARCLFNELNQLFGPSPNYTYTTPYVSTSGKITSSTAYINLDNASSQ